MYLSIISSSPSDVHVIFYYGLSLHPILHIALFLCFWRANQQRVGTLSNRRRALLSNVGHNK